MEDTAQQPTTPVTNMSSEQADEAALQMYERYFKQVLIDLTHLFTNPSDEEKADEGYLGVFTLEEYLATPGWWTREELFMQFIGFLGAEITPMFMEQMVPVLVNTHGFTEDAAAERVISRVGHIIEVSSERAMADFTEAMPKDGFADEAALDAMAAQVHPRMQARILSGIAEAASELEIGELQALLGQLNGLNDEDETAPASAH